MTNSPSPRGIWIVAVPGCAVFIAVLAISTGPEIRSPPPAMRAFAKSPQKAAVTQAVIRSRKKMSEPLVRVNVTPGGVDSFQLDVRGPSESISLDSSDNQPQKFDAERVTVSSTKKGLKIGRQQLTTNRLEISPVKSPSIRVNGHLYRGKMRLFRRTDGKVSAVNVLPIEDYLASVVDSEMPAKFPDDARQAQAIVARTYALYHVEHADPAAMFDLLSSQRSQKYLGVEYLDASGRRLAGESESSRKVVEATRGIVCCRNEKLFCTYYSAVCGGQTTHGKEVFENAEDVVKSVPCEWCRDSPHYRWTKELTRAEFQKVSYESRDTIPKLVRSIRQPIEPGNGRISRFELSDGQQEHTMTGLEFRERLPVGTLASPHFRIKLEKNRVVFEGRGHGHGVGFCQWGAKGQAEAGRTSFEIVRHYFPGAELTDLNYLK